MHVIEHVWDLLKRTKVRSQPLQPNPREFTQIWTTISQQHVNPKIHYIKKGQCILLTAAEGGHSFKFQVYSVYILYKFRFRSVLYIKATGPSYNIHINKHIYKHSCVHLQCYLPITIFHNWCLSGPYLEKHEMKHGL